MTNDPVNYVRQGALIASALIMIQQTEILCPKVSNGSSAGEVCKGEKPLAEGDRSCCSPAIAVALASGILQGTKLHFCNDI